ncbi:MAG TPA: RNA-binding protein [candidate division Zixibacteria bacterium]|nr:RNA-binding protein [candidate division Zixibacteria bacterium]
MKIYIGNMSFNTTEETVRQAFETYGEITSVNLISDRDTGRPKGFGFVEMANDEHAKAAIAGLNGTEIDGRAVNVNEARPRPEGGNRGGSRGGYRGGNRGGRSW